MRNNILKHTDLCLQTVDGEGCVVKNSQLRDVNFWYEVPPTVENGLHVPKYYRDLVHVEPTIAVQKKRRKQAKKKLARSDNSNEDLVDDEDQELEAQSLEVQSLEAQSLEAPA